MFSFVRNRLGFRLLALTLAALLCVWAPAGAATDPLQPTWTDQVQQRFQTNFSEGLAGQAGSMAAIQLGQHMQTAVSSLVGPALGSFLPPGVAQIAGALLGQFGTTFVAKLGMDTATQLYKKAVGKKSEKIDVMETLVGAAGSTIGTALLSAALGPGFGQFLGGWLGWNLATTLLEQHRKGHKLSLVGAVKASDIPRLFVEQGAINLSRLLSDQVLGSVLLAAVTATPIGAPLAWLTSTVFSSFGSSLALAFYDTAMERSALAAVGPRAPSNSWATRKPTTRELTTLRDALDHAYDRYVKAQRLKGQFDDDTQKAFRTYVVAQRDYQEAVDAVSR